MSDFCMDGKNPLCWLLAPLALLPFGCTPNNQKLDPLPPLDAGTDLDVDSDVDSDSDTDVDTDTVTDTGTDIDTDTDTDVDTDTETDTETDTVTDTETDTEMDAGPDAGEDAGLDGGTDTETETDTYTDTDTDTGGTWLDYDCRFVFTDFWGMQYSMFAETAGAGEMQFKAATGTDPAIESSRRTDAASLWPQDGQVVPTYALDLTGYYEFTASPIDPTLINVTFRSWDTTTLAFVDKMIFPVSEADSMTLDPLPVASDTSNEIYIGQNAILDADADCDAWDSVESVCTEFSKSVFFSIDWMLDLECWIP